MNANSVFISYCSLSCSVEESKSSGLKSSVHGRKACCPVSRLQVDISSDDCASLQRTICGGTVCRKWPGVAQRRAEAVKFKVVGGGRDSDPRPVIQLSADLHADLNAC